MFVINLAKVTAHRDGSAFVENEFLRKMRKTFYAGRAGRSSKLTVIRDPFVMEEGNIVLDPNAVPEAAYEVVVSNTDENPPET